MRRSFFLLCIALVVLGVGALQAQESQKPAISVTSAGKVTAKADLAIVFMTVRSTSPLAADALEQNNKKVQVLKDRLTALGYKEDKVKFSGNRFAPAGGPGIFYGGGQRPTGFDVTNSVFIYLEVRNSTTCSNSTPGSAACLTSSASWAHPRLTRRFPGSPWEAPQWWLSP